MARANNTSASQTELLAELESLRRRVRELDGAATAAPSGNAHASTIGPAPAAEPDLAASHRFIHRVLDTSPHMVYVFDLRERRCVYLGGQIQSIMGYTAEQMAAMGGNVLEKTLHPDELPRVAAQHAQFEATAADGDVIEWEYRMIHADGGVRWLRGRDTVFERDAAGRPRQLLGTAEDVTERREAMDATRVAESRFQAFFESAAVGASQGDPYTGRFLRVNDALCRITGYSRDELLAKTFTDLTYPEDREYNRDDVARLMSGELREFNIEKRYVRKDGRLIWVGVAVSLTRDAAGRPAQTVAIIQDVTVRRAAEHALRTINETLEARVRERTEELVRYQEQLRSLAAELDRAEHRQRKRLAAELHDNLAQLLAVCQLRLASLASEVPPTGVGNAEALRGGLARAMEYTRTLMCDLSPPALEFHDLARAVEWLGDKMREHDGLRVTVHDDGQPKPLGDEVLVVLYESVRELLFNVIKHGRTREATVRLERAGDSVRVTVTDHGAGFELPASPTPHAAVPDERGGFGLFNVRERLTRLGGQLAIESSPGKGTRAMLTMPMRG